MKTGTRTAPDGGYGWVICLAAFFVNFLADGIAASFAVFLHDYREYFGSTLASVSLAHSLLYGVFILQGNRFYLLVVVGSNNLTNNLCLSIIIC